MTFPDMIDLLRFQTKNYAQLTTELKAALDIAANRVFDAQGGFSNPAIAQRMVSTETGTVTPARLWFDTARIPSTFRPVTVVVDGDSCDVCSPQRYEAALNATGYRPFAKIEERRVTVALDPSFVSGHKDIIVVYTRPPVPMVWIEGLTVEEGTAQSGIGANKYLNEWVVVFPTDGETVLQNELVGATLSVRADDTWVDEYVIRSNPGGTLDSVFVDRTTKKRIALPLRKGADYSASGKAASYRLANIHRGSDLPPEMHQQIVDMAVTILTGAAK